MLKDAIRPAPREAIRAPGFSQRVAASGGGAVASWPLTGMGAESDWSLTGGAIWDDCPSFDAAPGESAALTGGAVATFNAAVTSSTACSVTLTCSPSGTPNGNLAVSMKGGAPVTFVFDGSGDPVTMPVTSGAGSGFSMTTGASPASGGISGVAISLA